MKNWISKFLFGCKNDGITLLASSLAFSTLLSFVPLLASTYVFLEVIGIIDQVEQSIQQVVVQYALPSQGEKLMDFVEEARSRLSLRALGIFGVAGMLILGYGIYNKTEIAFNRIYKAQRYRNILRRFLNFLVLFIVAPLIWSISIYLNKILFEWAEGNTETIFDVLSIIGSFLPYLLSSFAFFWMYFLFPSQKVSKRAAIISSLIAGFVFELLKIGFATYTKYSLWSSVYGALATLPLFLIWMQLIWTVILGGAEICYLLDLGVFKPLKSKNLS